MRITHDIIRSWDEEQVKQFILQSQKNAFHDGKIHEELMSHNNSDATQEANGFLEGWRRTTKELEMILKTHRIEKIIEAGPEDKTETNRRKTNGS